MSGSIVEVVCERVRESAVLLKRSGRFLDVQAFGDRLNVVVDDPHNAVIDIRAILAASSIPVGDTRRIAPSLENVFISMVSGAESAR